MWILPGWFHDNWWEDIASDVNCSVMMLRHILIGHISISWINRVDNTTKLDFGGVVSDMSLL